MDIAVIADDLTGANADGALLTAKGFPSATCLGLDVWDARDFAGYTAVSVSTDSRLLPPDDARKAVFTAGRLLAAEGPTLMAKRIDSTLRGNLGAEIEGALEALDAAGGGDKLPAVAVVVPSYPSSGRFAVGGYLIVHGVPLERSPIAKDAATPLEDSSVLRIIHRQTLLQTGHVPLETVLAGPEAIRERILELRREGCRIVACDAVTDEDIAAVAQALRQTDFPVLAVDPGPFTAELAAVRVTAPREQFENRVFLAVGSATALTRTQMEALHLAHPCHIQLLNVREVLRGEASRAEEIARVFAELRAAPEEASVLGVCTALSEGDVFSFEGMARELGLPPADISAIVTGALSELAHKVLDCPDLRVGGLYTSGGEVTVAVIRGLGARGFSVRDQVIPLAVYGRLIQGACPDLPMVTKGGFVGDKGSLVQCVEYLFTKISTRKRSEKRGTIE